MKSRQKTLLAAAVGLATISVVSLSSCSKGSKACPSGYTGDDCKTSIAAADSIRKADSVRLATLRADSIHLANTLAVRQQLIKIWHANDVVNGNTLTYTVNIDLDGSQTTGVNISSGFSNNFFSNPIKATIDSIYITIPNQKPDNGDYSVDGKGTFINNKINWTYTIHEITSSQTQTYTGVWQ